MKNFETLAVKYYKTFESYRENVGFFNWRTLALLVSVGLFFGGVFCWSQILRSSESFLPQMKAWGILIATEFLLIYLWKKTQDFKDKQVVKKVNLDLGRNCKDIREARKEWLRSSVGRSPTKYLQIAKDFREARRLARSYRSFTKFDRNNLVRLIFDPESKARVLSLVIFLLSLGALIVLRSLPPDMAPIEMIWEDGFCIYLGLLLFWGFMLWLAYLAILIVFEFISTFVPGQIDAWGSKGPSSTRASNVFLLALVENYEVPLSRANMLNARRRGREKIEHFRVE